MNQTNKPPLAPQQQGMRQQRSQEYFEKLSNQISQKFRQAKQTKLSCLLTTNNITQISSGQESIGGKSQSKHSDAGSQSTSISKAQLHKINSGHRKTISSNNIFLKNDVLNNKSECPSVSSKQDTHIHSENQLIEDTAKPSKLILYRLKKHSRNVSQEAQQLLKTASNKSSIHIFNKQNSTDAEFSENGKTDSCNGINQEPCAPQMTGDNWILKTEELYNIITKQSKTTETKYTEQNMQCDKEFQPILLNQQTQQNTLNTPKRIKKRNKYQNQENEILLQKSTATKESYKDPNNCFFKIKGDRSKSRKNLLEYIKHKKESSGNEQNRPLSSNKSGFVNKVMNFINTYEKNNTIGSQRVNDLVILKERIVNRDKNVEIQVLSRKVSRRGSQDDLQNNEVPTRKISVNGSKLIAEQGNLMQQSNAGSDNHFLFNYESQSSKVFTKYNQFLSKCRESRERLKDEPKVTNIFNPRYQEVDLRQLKRGGDSNIQKQLLNLQSFGSLMVTKAPLQEISKKLQDDQKEKNILNNKKLIERLLEKKYTNSKTKVSKENSFQDLNSWEISQNSQNDIMF